MKCDECGFVYDGVRTADVPITLRRLANRYPDVLLSPEAVELVSVRPATDTWSALEYACHVRDVLLVQRERLLLALVEDRPNYPRMYRDERVALAGYRRETIAEVANELTVAANLMAKVYEGLSAAQLKRLCVYNFPEPAERDMAWLGRHTVHEASHHLDDVRSALERTAS